MQAAIANLFALRIERDEKDILECFPLRLGVARVLRVLRGVPLCDIPSFGETPRRLFRSEKPVFMDARSAYEGSQPFLLFQPVLALKLR
jgi:hypothetical protein